MALGIFETLDWLKKQDKRLCCRIDQVYYELSAELATKITNQQGTPSFRSDTLANLPAPGQTGRMFISTDTFAFYRDNGIGWDLIGGPGIGTVTGSGTATQVAFWNGTSVISGSNNLFWDNANSRLGIGTSSPAYKLDVNGDLRVSTIANATTDTDKFIVSDGGVIKYRTGSELLSDIGGQGSLTLTTTGTSGAATLIGNTLNIPQYSGGGGGGISGSGTTNYLSKWTGSTALGDSQIFDNGTNVGIGTTSPTRKLTILGSSDALMDFNATSGRRYTTGVDGSSYIIFDDTVGLYRLAINSNGNLGIGTINPIYRLHVAYNGLGENGIRVDVSGDSTARNFLAQFNDAGRYSVIAYTGSNYFYGEALEIMTISSYPIKFYTNNSQKAVIFANGNFAIGTTTDAGYKLDVNGTARVQNILDIGTSTVNTGVFKIGPVPGTGSPVGGFWFQESSPSLSNTFLQIQTGFLDINTTGSIRIFTNNGQIATFSGNSTNADFYVLGSTSSSCFIGGWQLQSYNRSGGSQKDFHINGPAINFAFFIDGDNNNVGLNTTSPTARLSVVPANNTIGFDITGSSLTSANAQSLIDLAQTWNTTGSPTLIKANVTNTASGASSLLMDLQVGGTSEFFVTKNGDVGVNTASNDASAIMQIDSTTKGFLLPRMTDTQITGITTPANGLMVYSTTQNCPAFYDGTSWRKVSHSTL